MRLGRRGAGLLILAAFETGWGAGYLLEPPPPGVGLSVLDGHGGVGLWAWLWIVCGAVAFAAAWVRVGRDGAGFVAALVPPLVWSLVYAVAAVSGDYSRGGVAVVLYGAWSAFVMWAATVPEFAVPPPPPGSVRGRP